MAKRTRTPTKRARRTARAARVLRALPAPAQQLPLVQRAVDLGDARVRDLGNAIVDLEAKVLAEVEVRRERTEREARSWLIRLQKSPAARTIRELPRRFERSVDGLLDRMGLVRKQRHLDLLARAKRRAKPKRKQRARPRRRVAAVAPIVSG